ncbi:MAG: hypothetical protein ACREO5_00170 [Candidatus Binatia bacterium]
MGIPKAPVKPDDASLDKYYYLCQTRGCGAVINTEFPVGLKNPAPKYCKSCQNKDERKMVEEEYDRRNAPHPAEAPKTA